MAARGRGFLWGAASAAYQVEGGWQADGKGLSNWDVYTNRDRVTVPATGRQQTGNVAINAYDRAQYLADIGLMLELGINAYRFSIAWTRILPEGTGAVNQAGLDHYRRFVDDLLAAGIEPVATLFHWDLPQALKERGGWRNRESVDWFRNYARLVREAIGDRVDKVITFNEPFIDVFLIDPAAQNVKDGVTVAPISDAQWARQAIAMHHWMLASALTMGDYREAGYRGSLGASIPMMPTIPARAGDPDDIAAAEFADAVINRWCLDSMFKGRYPAAVVEAFSRRDPTFAAVEADYPILAANRADFLGVNFYAPTYVRAEKGAPLDFVWAALNPDPPPQAFNGPVRPEALKALLLRIRDEWGNPPVYITENGAGFGDQDDTLANGQVADPLRADYIHRHIDAALAAKAGGADLRGYMLWSLFDNFEWMQGYDRRFGIVHVDFDTLKRTKKQSFETYRQIIAKGV